MVLTPAMSAAAAAFAAQSMLPQQDPATELDTIRIRINELRRRTDQRYQHLQTDGRDMEDNQLDQISLCSDETSEDLDSFHERVNHIETHPEMRTTRYYEIN
jgi:hypothetical protein